MNPRIIFATNNDNKMVEIRAILADLQMEILDMKGAGIDMDIVEDGTTFEENALIKARALANILPNDIILADDSGLEIDYLNKAPGVYSARFEGRDTPYEIKNRKLLGKLEGVPDEQRSARFVCVIAMIIPGVGERIERGTIEGRIGYECKGSNGFGYDPIFYVPEYGMTTAQMDEALKNQLSHRGKALAMVKADLLASFSKKETNSLH